jgi:hypothetical protein
MEILVNNIIRTATAFAITVATGYALCTLVFWIWPEAAASFMNALFHGLDFRKLRSDPALFSFGSFLYALCVMTAWAFVLGALFGWMSERFAIAPERRSL